MPDVRCLAYGTKICFSWFFLMIMQYAVLLINVIIYHLVQCCCPHTTHHKNTQSHIVLMQFNFYQERMRHFQTLIQTCMLLFNKKTVAYSFFTFTTISLNQLFVVFWKSHALHVAFFAFCIHDRIFIMQWIHWNTWNMGPIKLAHELEKQNLLIRFKNELHGMQMPALVLVRNSLNRKNIKLIHWMWSSWPGELNIRFLFHFLFCWHPFLVYLHIAHIGHGLNVVVVSQSSVLIKTGKRKWKEKINNENKKTVSMEQQAPDWRRIACKTEWTRINIKFIRMRFHCWIQK